MKKDSQISVIEKGVYNTTGDLFFVGGCGISSHVSRQPIQNAVRIHVTSIDDVVVDDISFLKMDIEGSEKEASIGAKEHITSSYPFLAISIYHSIDDLWTIPLMIREMFPQYTNFELRHHGKTFAETVLYAYRIEGV